MLQPESNVLLIRTAMLIIKVNGEILKTSQHFDKVLLISAVLLLFLLILVKRETNHLSPPDVKHLQVFGKKLSPGINFWKAVLDEKGGTDKLVWTDFQNQISLVHKHRVHVLYMYMHICIYI